MLRWSWVLGFKVPEGHFYTLSGTGKSSQLLWPLSVQDINCMLGSVIMLCLTEGWEWKKTELLCPAVHSFPCSLWAMQGWMWAPSTARTHTQPSKGQKAERGPRKEGHQGQKWLKWAMAQNETDNCQQNRKAEGQSPGLLPGLGCLLSFFSWAFPSAGLWTELLGTLNQKAAVKNRAVRGCKGLNKGHFCESSKHWTHAVDLDPDPDLYTHTYILCIHVKREWEMRF